MNKIIYQLFYIWSLLLVLLSKTVLSFTPTWWKPKKIEPIYTSRLYFSKKKKWSSCTMHWEDKITRIRCTKLWIPTWFNKTSDEQIKYQALIKMIEQILVDCLYTCYIAWRETIQKWLGITRHSRSAGSARQSDTFNTKIHF